MCKDMLVEISNGLEVFFTTISHTVMAHMEVGEFFAAAACYQKEMPCHMFHTQS